jgi:asparagine synthase (glutamine-hydrolysing)
MIKNTELENLCFGANNELEFITKPFYTIDKSNYMTDQDAILEKLHQLTINAVKKRIPTKKMKIGLLYSGGLDSLAIALILKELNVEFTCYVTGFNRPNVDSKDVTHAIESAKIMGLDLEVVNISLTDFEDVLKETITLIEDNHVVKNEVGSTFNYACKKAKQDNVKLIFSGLGSEEIFAGYNRHLQSF